MTHVTTKTSRIGLVATAEQRALWQKCAAVAGLSLSEWLRRSAEREVGNVLLQTGRRPDLVALVGR